MKIKQDFVTNSSSTSFIIGQETEGSPMKTTIKMEIDLSRFVSEEYHSLKDLENAIESEDWYFSDEEKDKMRQIIWKGGKVYQR